MAQTPLRLKAVTPCRLVDTRNGQPIQGGTAQAFNLPSLAQSGGVGGACGSFDLSSALAYSLNVTLVSGGTRVRYLTIWPTGEPQPVVSLMNSFDGRTKANAAIVPAGNSGKVSVYVSDTTNILIDINAYFASAADSSALAFFPLPPCRIVDTRSSGGPIPGRQEHDFSIPGNCGIPTNAQAYSFNITALPSGTLGYVSVWPAGESQPTVSTLNDYTGTFVANAAIVPAGTENKTAVYPSATTNLLIDTNGYFAPASSAASPLSLYTITPCRVLDTRQTIGPFNGTIPVGIVGSLCGVPNVAQAFTLNATVLPSGALGFLTLWPEGSTQPGVSTLNAPDGAVTSNMAIVPAGSGNESINAFASGTNPTHLILDVASYFAPIATLAVLTSTLPDGTLNSGYTVQLVATGGVPPYTWRKTTGTLPPGLSVSSTGLLEGTTTATGNYSFSVEATDSNSPAATATANLQITVNGSAGTLVIRTSSLSNGTINTPYNALLSANGGITPYSWTILSGALPIGLSLDAHSGLISGTPGAAGTTSATIQVTDVQNDTATQLLTLTIDTGGANGTLNGMYAISFQGFDHSVAFAAAGSLTFDGNGHVTAGETDVNGFASGVEHDQITGGTYSIDPSGLGLINWTDDHGGNVQMLVATGSAETMRIIAYNTNGLNGTWGAGVLRQQNPSDFNAPALAGNWTFGLQGFDPAANPTSSDGNYSESSTGVFSNGAEDINDFGNHSQVTFTGSVSGTIDANGRSTSQIHIGSETFNYAAYVISANEVLLVEIDSGGSVTITNTLRQSGTMNNGILNGNSAARGSRIHHAGEGDAANQAVVLLINSSGTGNMNLSLDTNTGGTVSLGSEAGTYAVEPNGRTSINLPGGAVIVCYVVASNEGFCINAIPGTGDVKGAEVLYFEPQSAGPFNNASLQGEYLGGSLALYKGDTDSSINTLWADGAGNGSLIYDQSGPDGTQLNQPGTGTYTVDSTGAVTLLSNGSPIGYGFMISANKFCMISTDSNPRALIQVTSSAPHHH